MKDKPKNEPRAAENADRAGGSESTDRWMAELGEEIELLGFMMRKPLEGRPFVYEIRIDLIPGKGGSAVLVAKGFGDAGGLVAFHNASGFLGLLRGFEAQLRAGKVNWIEDQYPPANYDKRRARYLSGEYYRV